MTGRTVAITVYLLVYIITMFFIGLDPTIPLTSMSFNFVAMFTMKGCEIAIGIGLLIAV